MTARSRLAVARPPWLTGAVLVDVVLILVLGYLLFEATQLFGGAKRFPMVTLPVTMALLAVDLVLTLSPSLRRRAGFVDRDYIDVERGDATTADADRQTSDTAAQRQGPRRPSPWLVLLWLIGLGVGMVLVGYAIMTPIFLVAFFLWVRVPLKVAAGITLVMSGLNYVVFYELLGYT